jgi:F0F1-type ATP synthase membrane subunit b/b'
MSQTPAKSRDNGADGTSSRDNVAADATSESQESADLAASPAGKRVQAAPGRPPVAQTSLKRSSSVPQPGQGRAASVTRAATGPVRAIAANDDMPSIGGLVYALQQRPSKSPFYIALAASAVWFLLGCLIAWAVIAKNPEAISSLSEIFATPSIVAVIATIIVPIALFWFLAVLVWRAQELRLMSSAMTEVAVRLAEPDKMAEQSVASLGQTVRRQVAAMNDAISRALGRAGELEALVHNEVAALERSYSENENRIRNLINELASEREALANNSDRVSEALRGIGSHVTREISAASERASTAMTQATSTLADTLASRGNKITAAVTAAGAVIDEKLADRGARITEQLVKHGAQAAEQLHRSGLEVTRSIQETSDRTAAAISAKGNNLVASVMSMSERVGREIPVLLERLGSEQTRLSGIIEGATKNLSALEGALAQRTESLNTSLHDRTKMLQTVLTEQGKAIDNSLSERTQALEAILGRRAQAFDATLAERTKSLDASVSRYTGNIRETLEQHSRTMEKSLSRQAGAIQHVVTTSTGQIQRAVEDLARGSGASSDSLGAHANMLKEVSNGLLNQIHGLTKRFEDQGVNIMNAARAVEAQNNKVDTVMETRQAQLGKMIEGINTRASELDRMMHNYSNMLEQSLAQAEVRAKQVTETLSRDSADKSQTAVKELERLRAEAQAHTSRAISELKSNFSSLSEQVASQLSGFTSSFNETTQQVRNSTHQAAAELEHTQSELKRQAKSLPEATKQSAKAMRRALQDQLSALDSLTEITSRHGYSGQISKPDSRQSEPNQPPRMLPPQHENRDLPPLGAVRRDTPPPPPRGAYGEEWGAPQDTLEAVSAGLIERMDNSPLSNGQHEYDSMGRPPIMSSPAPNPEIEHERGGAKWSLGDLLARASLVDDNNYAGGRSDDSYGAPPPVAPSAGPGRKPDNSPMIFDMKDIANAVEETIAADVWRRYHKGERNILNRGIYSRDGQATFDQVKHRYESDSTFRHIVDRYLADFERMLQDASKADPKGRTVQTHLTSETGRIYLVLGHASGRLVV